MAHRQLISVFFQMPRNLPAGDCGRDHSECRKEGDEDGELHGKRLKYVEAD